MSSTVKTPKVSTPETFDGTTGKLESFLLQVKLYTIFNAPSFEKESDKVLYATSFLRGRAAKGFRPYLKNWIENHDTPADCETETAEIFGDFDEFEEKLKSLYGIADEEVHADQGIRKLRQNYSVATYASEFQGFAADLEWNDAALRSQFYFGLKDTIKDELMRSEKQDNLNSLIETAKAIDEKFHYRFQEKNRYHPKTHDHDPYGTQPMQIDGFRTKKLSNQEKDDRAKKKLCFYCGKPGHQARGCPSKQTL